MKLRKPWTPEILMACYCVARKKPIRREKTKPQTATVISLWFWGLLACPELYFDWALDNKHSWNISGVRGFLSLIVTNYYLSSVFCNQKWKISTDINFLRVDLLHIFWSSMHGEWSLINMPNRILLYLLNQLIVFGAQNKWVIFFWAIS